MNKVSVLHDAHPQWWEPLSQHVQDKITDRSEKVREAAVLAVAHIAANHPAKVQAELLKTMAKRTDDIKTSVRVAALRSLAALFKLHCGEFWKDGQPLPADNRIYSWLARRLLAGGLCVFVLGLWYGVV